MALQFIIHDYRCYSSKCVSTISAGVGRTGVFITLSIVLERMRYEGVVDIFQTVKMLRTQRPATVQTEVSRLLLSVCLPSCSCLVRFLGVFFAPSHWSSLPEELRGVENVAIFKLKTHLYFVRLLFSVLYI